METVKKVSTVVISVLLWAVILLAAFYAFTTLATKDQNNVANFLGFTPLTVQSDSMVPEFKAGDLIIIKTCDPDKLEVGDVVTFHTIIENQYALNTHRIAEIKETNGVRAYTTKGDNNAISDTHIIANGDIVGKYVGKVAGLGNVMDFLSSSLGFFVVIVLPMLVFFIYQVYHLIMVSVKLKKATAAEAAAEAASGDAAKLSEAEARVKELEAQLAKAQQMAEAEKSKE